MQIEEAALYSTFYSALGKNNTVYSMAHVSKPKFVSTNSLINFFKC